MVTTDTMVSIAVTVVIFVVMLFATYVFTVHIYSDVFICFYDVIGVCNNNNNNNNSESNRSYSEFVFWN